MKPLLLFIVVFFSCSVWANGLDLDVQFFSEQLASHYPEIELEVKENSKLHKNSEAIYWELDELEKILLGDKKEPKQPNFRHLSCCKVVCGGCGRD